MESSKITLLQECILQSHHCSYDPGQPPLGQTNKERHYTGCFPVPYGTSPGWLRWQCNAELSLPHIGTAFLNLDWSKFILFLQMGAESTEDLWHGQLHHPLTFSTCKRGQAQQYWCWSTEGKDPEPSEPFATTAVHGNCSCSTCWWQQEEIEQVLHRYFSTVPKELFFIVATFSSSFVHQNLFQQLDENITIKTDKTQLQTAFRTLLMHLQ